jgi:NADP-dependent 3-hydroxy acid dehydrogenase YdfG
MQQFQDKVVVASAASGTGEATARRLSSEGARVASIEQPPQA